MFNKTNVLSNLEPSKKTMGSHAGTPATATAYLRQRTYKSSFIYEPAETTRQKTITIMGIIMAMVMVIALATKKEI